MEGHGSPFAEVVDYMRLATLIDPTTRKPTTVFVLPGGQKIDLCDAVHYAPVGASQDYFANLVEVASHLDFVLPAISGWRSNLAAKPQAVNGHARFLPPVPAPRSFRDFYAFEQHVKACRAKRGLEMVPAWYQAPAFYFSNPGSLIGHDAPVYAPRGSVELDYELELGIVIGQGGKDITARDAWKHVAGFTIINDLSARDVQRAEMTVGLGPAKGKDFATAVGPYLVTLDDLADRIDTAGRVHLKMAARVNGKQLSQGRASEMYFTWPQLIEHASRDVELYPGDLIGSGTVGTGCILELGPENTGGWLKPGDVVELEIERLGILRTPIVDRPDAGETLRESVGGALATV
jgi:fumarylacetoacetate (FAA) hydrolase